MSIRRRALPRGWYPDHRRSVLELLSAWASSSAHESERAAAPQALAAVAPHAGWAFSGRLAALAASSLAPQPTLAIFGGHLPRGARPLAAGEESFETPLGPLDADLELLHALASSIGLGADEEGDNTVEVLLPLAAALFPGVKILWLRAANDESALELGEALWAASSATGRPVACLGSTDLTHYGPNYGYSPKGQGPSAEAWVTQRNDRRFIEALLAMDGPEALRLAERERSACSPGAAAAALAFARSAGATAAELLAYSTSLEFRRDDSFVGYAAIAFRKELP